MYVFLNLRIGVLIIFFIYILLIQLYYYRVSTYYISNEYLLSYIYYLIIGGNFTAFDDLGDHVGIGKITILNDTTLVFDYIRTISLEVYDTITLTRDHSRYEII
jgi:hypothetical protein